jgi:exonuclease III
VNIPSSHGLSPKSSKAKDDTQFSFIQNPLRGYVVVAEQGSKNEYNGVVCYCRGSDHEKQTAKFKVGVRSGWQHKIPYVSCRTTQFGPHGLYEWMKFQTFRNCDRVATF